MATAPRRPAAAQQQQRQLASARKTAEQNAAGGMDMPYRIPHGMKRLEIGNACTKRLDILPYKVKNNPNCEPGTYSYERTFYAHRGIGAKNGWYICEARSFGRPCPICEYIKSESRNPDADKEMLKSIGAKQRQLFIVKDTERPQDGFQIMEMSPFNFGEMLGDVIIGGDNGEYDQFYDPESGYTVKATFKMASMGQGTSFAQVAAIEMKARTKNYTWKEVDGLPCLDDLLIVTPYTKLSQIFYQIDTSASGDDAGDDPVPTDDDVVPSDDDDTPTDADADADADAGDGDVVPSDDDDVPADDGDAPSDPEDDDAVPSDDDDTPADPEDDDAVPSDDPDDSGVDAIPDDDDPNLGFEVGHYATFTDPNDENNTILGEIVWVKDGLARLMVDGKKFPVQCEFLAIAEKPAPAPAKKVAAKPAATPAKAAAKPPAKPVATKPAATPAKAAAKPPVTPTKAAPPAGKPPVGGKPPAPKAPPIPPKK